MTAEQTAPAEQLVLIVEPDSSPARPPILAAVRDAGLVPRLCSETNTALQLVEESLAGGARIVGAILGPHLTSPVAAAHRLHSRVPSTKLFFVLPDARRAEAMSRSLSFDPILDRSWSVLALDDPSALYEALRGIDELALGYQRRRCSGDDAGRELAIGARKDQSAFTQLASDSYLASLLRQAQDAIVALGPTGTIVAWNDAASNLFGIVAYKAVGCCLWKLASESDQALWEQCFLQARSGRAIRREVSWRRPDSVTIDLEVSFAPVHDSTGQVVGVSVIARDVSERRRTEAALREAASLKDEFLAIASHELRTPLTTVIGFTTVLRRRVLHSSGPPDREQVLRATDAILRAGQRLSQLLDELLDVSQAQRGLFELRPAPCNLGTLVSDVASRLADTVVTNDEPPKVTGEAESTLSGPRIVVWEPQEPIVGHWDARRLDQAVAHLVTNALRCSPAGSRVIVTIARDGEHALLDVQDFGVGITIEEQARLFEPFFRTGATSNLGGLGLGLFLTREVVKSHGGDIWIESEPGTGTSIHVRLPLRPPGCSGASADSHLGGTPR